MREYPIGMKTRDSLNGLSGLVCSIIDIGAEVRSDMWQLSHFVSVASSNCRPLERPLPQTTVPAHRCRCLCSALPIRPKICALAFN